MGWVSYERFPPRGKKKKKGTLKQGEARRKRITFRDRKKEQFGSFDEPRDGKILRILDYRAKREDNVLSRRTIENNGGTKWS